MKRIIDYIDMQYFDWFDRRCGKCPSIWEERGYEDWDSGCHLSDLNKSFCKYAFMPRWIVKLLVKLYLYREAKYWEKWEWEKEQ